MKSIDESLLHPSAHALLKYWRIIHSADGLPGRQDFDPAAVVELLPNLILVGVHRDPLRFHYRLLGSRVDAVKAKSFTGQWLDQAYAGEPDCVGTIHEYAQVVETGEPMWRRGRPRVVSDEDCRTIEALRLPLASDGRIIDMILCIVLYFDREGRPFDLVARRGVGCPRHAAAETLTRSAIQIGRQGLQSEFRSR